MSRALHHACQGSKKKERKWKRKIVKKRNRTKKGRKREKGRIRKKKKKNFLGSGKAKFAYPSKWGKSMCCWLDIATGKSWQFQ